MAPSLQVITLSLLMQMQPAMVKEQFTSTTSYVSVTTIISRPDLPNLALTFYFENQRHSYSTHLRCFKDHSFHSYRFRKHQLLRPDYPKPLIVRFVSPFSFPVFSFVRAFFRLIRHSRGQSGRIQIFESRVLYALSNNTPLSSKYPSTYFKTILDWVLPPTQSLSLITFVTNTPETSSDNTFLMADSINSKSFVCRLAGLLSFDSYRFQITRLATDLTSLKVSSCLLTTWNLPSVLLCLSCGS